MTPHELRQALTGELTGSERWADVAIELACVLGETDAGLDEAIEIGQRVAAAFPDGEEHQIAILHLGVDHSRRFHLRGQSTDLDWAIRYGEQLLENCSEEYSQVAHSHLGGRLVTAYEHAAPYGDLDRAILLLETAERLPSHDEEDHIGVIANLAAALRRRYERDHTRKDLDRSVALDERVQELLDDSSQDRAGYLANRAVGQLTLWEASGELEHLDNARVNAQAAYLHPGLPRDVASRYLLSLAQIEAALSEQTDNSELLDGAAAKAELGLKMIDPSVAAYPHHLTSLASMLAMQHQRGNESALQRAITLNEIAMSVASPGSGDWETALNERMGHLSERFVQAGNSGDLREAIAVGRDALELATRDTTRGSILTNLATALRQLAQVSPDDETALLDEAIVIMDEALEVTGHLSIHGASRFHTASIVYEERAHVSVHPAEAETLKKKALQAARDALEHPAAVPADRYIYLARVGNLLAEGDVEDLNDAIVALTDAFDLVDEGAPAEPRVLYSLASKYELRYSTEGARDDLQAAIDAYDHILTLDEPTVAVFAAQRLGDIGCQLGMWDKAERAFKIALDHAESNTEVRRERVDKERARFDIQGVGSYAALAAHQLDKPQVAVSHLERVASTLLSRRDHTKLDKPIEAAAVVYIADTPTGGVAAIIEGTDIRTIELPELRTDAIHHALKMLRTAFEPTVGDEFAQWNAAVEALLQFTWDTVAATIHTELTSHESMVLVPVGSSAGLPIEAARSDEGQSLLHGLCISRLPTARIDLPEVPTPNRPFLIADHGPKDRRIPSVGLEVELIKQVWPHLRTWGNYSVGTNSHSVLRKSRTPPRNPKEPDSKLRTQLKEADLLHIACHYDIDRQNPQNSTLELQAPVRVSDLLGELSSHPHVILSACDSGLAGERLPDESIGAGSALLDAGASAVTAALWPLDDLSTPKFMGIFHSYLQQRMAPSQALRHAQLELFGEPPMVWAPFVHVGRP